MKIVLTSFRDANNWRGWQCSIARWQPDWSTMPEFPVDVKPIFNGRKLGEWLSPDFYRKIYETKLYTKEQELIDFFSKIETDEPIVLCCWCTLERQKSEKLFCHRILLGWWIEEYFKYAQVIYTDGAEKPIWQIKIRSDFGKKLLLNTKILALYYLNCLMSQSISIKILG